MDVDDEVDDHDKGEAVDAEVEFIDIPEFDAQPVKDDPMPVPEDSILEVEYDTDPLDNVKDVEQVGQDANPEEAQHNGDDDEIEDDLFVAGHLVIVPEEDVEDDDDNDPPPDDDLELEAEEDGFEDEDIDDGEILHDELLLQVVGDEVEVFNN